MFHGLSILKTVYVSGCQTIGCKNKNFNTDPVKKIRNFKFNIFYLKQEETIGKLIRSGFENYSGFKQIKFKINLNL